MKFYERVISDFGGYEKCKDILSQPNIDFIMNTQGLREHMLEYRRQHNIYEVEDKVVIESYRNTYISCGRPSQYSIGDLMVIHNLDGNVISDNDYNFIDYRDVRHATDAEIEAGKRLEVS